MFAEYFLPIDESELDRLDLNHYKYYVTLGGKYFLAPIANDVQAVLDIGTGTGIWALDFADKYPSARVIGIDIAVTQPEWVAPNCAFHISDAELDWTFKLNYFDYIHLRDMGHAIHNWKKIVQQCFNHAKPGGWVEFGGVLPEPRSDDNTLDPKSTYKALGDAWVEIDRNIECDPDSAKIFKALFLQQGFKQIKKTVFKIPSSPWPKDQLLKEIGAIELVHTCDTDIEGTIIKEWTKKLRRPLEGLKSLIREERNEMRSSKVHSYLEL